MKSATKCVKNYLSLTVIVRGEKYSCASEEALIQSLVNGGRDKVRGLAKGSLKWLEKITRGDGKKIFPQDIYRKSYSIILKDKAKYKKAPKKIKSATYGKEKGYLFDMKDRDVIDKDEPRGKKVIERGFYFYEDSWYRKTERNWKSFRKTQYR